MKLTTTIDGRTVELQEDGYADLDRDDYRTADGQRFTEADAARLSQEMSRRGSLGGRPALDPGSPSIQVGVRVSAAMKRRLEASARARGVPESAILREALNAYLSAS